MLFQDYILAWKPYFLNIHLKLSYVCYLHVFTGIVSYPWKSEGGIRSPWTYYYRLLSATDIALRTKLETLWKSCRAPKLSPKPKEILSKWRRILLLDENKQGQFFFSLWVSWNIPSALHSDCHFQMSSCDFPIGDCTVLVLLALPHRRSQPLSLNHLSFMLLCPISKWPWEVLPSTEEG